MVDLCDGEAFLAPNYDVKTSVLDLPGSQNPGPSSDGERFRNGPVSFLPALDQNDAEGALRGKAKCKQGLVTRLKDIETQDTAGKQNGV
jgi:hypothetical protein